MLYICITLTNHTNGILLILFDLKNNNYYIFIRLLNTHEELKKNWNAYKQKQTNCKAKLRLEILHIIL